MLLYFLWLPGDAIPDMKTDDFGGSIVMFKE